MKKKQRTVKCEYTGAGLPLEMGQDVNDFLAEHGIKAVQIGKRKLKVEPKGKRNG